MKQEESEQLLEQHGIKATSNRILVLKTLADAGRPLSLSEMEQRLLSVDKSGIFRALTLFREHHLVHAIDDAVGGLHYELCYSHSDDSDDDLHAHFFCEQCHRTFCLHEVQVPQVQVPAGFAVMSASYMMKGLCPQCSEKQ